MPKFIDNLLTGFVLTNIFKEKNTFKFIDIVHQNPHLQDLSDVSFRILINTLDDSFLSLENFLCIFLIFFGPCPYPLLQIQIFFSWLLLYVGRSKKLPKRYTIFNVVDLSKFLVTIYEIDRPIIKIYKRVEKQILKSLVYYELYIF